MGSHSVIKKLFALYIEWFLLLHDFENISDLIN